MLSIIKNIRNENCLDAVNLTNKGVFNKNSKLVDVFNTDVTMKKIFVDINSNSQAVKYRKTKQIKLSSIQVLKTSKRPKKLT